MGCNGASTSITIAFRPRTLTGLWVVREHHSINRVMAYQMSVDELRLNLRWLKILALDEGQEHSLSRLAFGDRSGY